ncbi:hypothetical protein ACJZ2D_002186 [Fusarium nematophilum]
MGMATSPDKLEPQTTFALTRNATRRQLNLPIWNQTCPIIARPLLVQTQRSSPCFQQLPGDDAREWKATRSHPRPRPNHSSWTSLKCLTNTVSKATGKCCGNTLTDHAQECRNVLVRYCAHIPRNYQYRDGIRLVFLVLRDHLGDECLGLAGGVLYEMIEVDCQHSDDPGAAFQRWRHDHMNRHADLELPHVPHLTTITSAIVPTGALIRWREDHAQRYRTRLSDHSPNSARSSFHTSGIRTKKDWIIEYTMYVSSRDGGTRPFRQLNAQEFHEMQWGANASQAGRLVAEKSIDLGDLLWKGDADSPTNSTEAPIRRLSVGLRISKSPSRLSRLLGKLRSPEKPVACLNKMEDVMRGPDCATPVSLRDMLEQGSNLQVSDGEIPNANFARKFGLYTDNRPLPPLIGELPVAEDKAMDMVARPPMRGLMYSWKFQGPFTPQLWFDSGLDYRWKRKSY